jgi:hypothetical protein
MSEFAAWTGETPDAGPEPSGPDLTAAAGSWLPASVQRRIAVEEQAERRLARAADRERQDREESAHERAVGAYRAAAEARGEQVPALAIARGEGLGRSLQDVLGDATAAADHEDARQAARAHREAGLEPAHVEVGRSDGWPSSSYELDRQLRQADELHHDRIAYRARLASRQGRSAEHIEAERAKADHARGRDTRRSGYYDAGEITRYAPTPACDRCGHVRCQCR